MNKSIPLVAVMTTIIAVFVSLSLLFMPNEVTAAALQHQPVMELHLPRAVVVQPQQHQLVGQRSAFCCRR